MSDCGIFLIWLYHDITGKSCSDLHSQLYFKMYHSIEHLQTYLIEKNITEPKTFTDHPFHWQLIGLTWIHNEHITNNWTSIKCQIDSTTHGMQQHTQKSPKGLLLRHLWDLWLLLEAWAGQVMWILGVIDCYMQTNTGLCSFSVAPFWLTCNCLCSLSLTLTQPLTSLHHRT